MKRRTSGSIKVGDPVEDDAVQEQRRRVDLHGAAQEAVEDPNVPASQSRKTGVNHFLPQLVTSAQLRFCALGTLDTALSIMHEGSMARLFAQQPRDVA